MIQFRSSGLEAVDGFIHFGVIHPVKTGVFAFPGRIFRALQQGSDWNGHSVGAKMQESTVDGNYRVFPSAGSVKVLREG